MEHPPNRTPNAGYPLTKSQHVRSVENIPEEAAEFAEVASQLIERHPENRRAVAELAALLGAGAAGAAAAAVGAGIGPSAATVGAPSFRCPSSSQLSPGSSLSAATCR